MVVRPWDFAETEKGLIPVPRKPLLCPFCRRSLVLHRFTAGQASEGFWHVDVNMKCPECGWYVIFGVPATKEECEKLKSSPLFGKTLREWPWEPEEEVKERLRMFGYW